MIAFVRVGKPEAEPLSCSLAEYREALTAVGREYTFEGPQPGKWLRVDADFVSAMFEKASPTAPTDSTGGVMDDDPNPVVL